MMSMFFIGCGVSSDSSDGTLTSSTDGNGNGSDTNTTDTNTTDTNGTGGTVVVEDPSDSGFSKTDAEEDSNACVIDDVYQVIADSSFDPLATGDVDNGVEIASQYNYSTDLEATQVALYYPDLKETREDERVNIYEDNYRFSFDKAWPSNDVSRVYIRTPKDINGIYSCYRYDLGSLSGDSITKTKVYR